MRPSNDSLNTFEYGLYWEPQQSRLYPIEAINIIEPHLVSYFLGAFSFM